MSQTLKPEEMKPEELLRLAVNDLNATIKFQNSPLTQIVYFTQNIDKKMTEMIRDITLLKEQNNKLQLRLENIERVIKHG